MEVLKTVLFGTLYVAGILLLIAIIIATLQAIVDNIRRRKDTKEAIKVFNEFLDDYLEETINELEEEVEEEKPKKTRKRKAKKEEE